MSRRFSIFTKGMAVVVVVAMCTVLMPEAQAYHCAQKKDDLQDAIVVLGIYGLAATGACSPASLATIGGAILCAAAMIAYFHQASEVREAQWALDACNREHEPN